MGASKKLTGDNFGIVRFLIWYNKYRKGKQRHPGRI